MGMGQSCQETPPLSPIREKWHVNQWFGALLVTAAGGPRPSKTYPTEGIMTMTRKMLVLPRASRVLLLLSAVLVSAPGTIVHADPVLTLSVNQTTFRPGDILHVGLQEENPGAGFYADLYFGILLPDGVTVFFFTSLSPLNGVLTRVDANPQTFPPLTPYMLISQGLDVTLNDVFVFPFSGSEPLGTYVLFALLTPPNAFTDGRVDAGDILVIDTTSFTTTTACCRVCTIGQACGDSCIPVALTCHQPPGCACNG